MEEPALTPSADTITCENCAATYTSAQKFCSSCSFPIGGSDEEKSTFRKEIGSRKLLLKDARKKIDDAKIVIYVIAGLMFLVGLFQFFFNDDFISLILNLCLSVVYLILAAWADKNPFGAILIAFILYITVNIVNAFFYPASLFQGIIIKAIFIGAFIKGTRSAAEARSLMNELEKVKAAPAGGYQ